MATKRKNKIVGLHVCDCGGKLDVCNVHISTRFEVESIRRQRKCMLCDTSYIGHEVTLLFLARVTKTVQWANVMCDMIHQLTISRLENNGEKK